MIPNFLVFSFLHYFEKNKIKTSSGYKNRELRLTDKPEWTWNDYSWTAGSHMDPRVVDITEEMGKWMDLKCAQPNNTNIMRNPQGESWLGPTWLGVEGGGGMMMTLCYREPGMQLKHQPASRRELYSCHLLSYMFPGMIPTPILAVGQETVDTKSEFASWMFRLQIYPSRHQESLKRWKKWEKS